MAETTEESRPARAITTAGLRGAGWNPARLPADVRMSVHLLYTEDGKPVTGYLFRRGGEHAVVCSMHPRELLVPQYVVPEVLRGGCAMWVMGSRSPNNDLRLEHEETVLDLAAGQRFLREECGFRDSILLGISGGGPLAAFYCQQSGRAGPERLQRSASGKRTGFERATLPRPDGIILISSHLGQGRLLMNCIDPAVKDENDPLQSDDALSAFDLANGFRRPPESSAYSVQFIERYRAAQRARVARIDAFARACIARRLEAKGRLKQKPDRADAILAAHSPIFNVWRTDADLRCFDLSLDPSQRTYGSLWGANPVASNYGSAGFARVCTPESWLSSWSGLSSNASMQACAPSVDQPVLCIEFTADNCVFPAEADAIYGWLGSADKIRHRLHGNHHGLPVAAGAADGQLEAGARIREWLREEGFERV